MKVVTFTKCGEGSCQALLPSDSDGPRMYGAPDRCSRHRRQYEMRLRQELKAAVTLAATLPEYYA